MQWGNCHACNRLYRLRNADWEVEKTTGQCTVYNLHCIMYIVHYTLYSAYCVQYTLYFVFPRCGVWEWTGNAMLTSLTRYYIMMCLYTYIYTCTYIYTYISIRLYIYLNTPIHLPQRLLVYTIYDTMSKCRNDAMT